MVSPSRPLARPPLPPQPESCFTTHSPGHSLHRTPFHVPHRLQHCCNPPALGRAPHTHWTPLVRQMSHPMPFDRQTASVGCPLSPPRLQPWLPVSPTTVGLLAQGEALCPVPRRTGHLPESRHTAALRPTQPQLRGLPEPCSRLRSSSWLSPCWVLTVLCDVFPGELRTSPHPRQGTSDSPR